MPQSIDDFLSSSTPVKKKLQSIDEYLNPPEPSYDFKQLADEGKLPSFNMENSELSQQAGQFAKEQHEAALRANIGYNPTLSDSVEINLGRHPQLADSESVAIDTSKLNPYFTPQPQPETPKQNIVYGPVAETLLYGAQGLSQPMRTLGELTPSIRSQVPQFAPEQAQFISPRFARGSEIAGQLVGSIPGYEGLTATLGRGAAQGLAKLGAGKLGQFIGREAATGAGFEAANQAADVLGDTNHGGTQSLTDRLKAIVEGGAVNAALGGAFHGAIGGAKAGLSPLLAKQTDKQAFNQAINNFIQRTQRPRGPEDFVPHPYDALIREAGGVTPPNPGDQFAANFNRGIVTDKPLPLEEIHKIPEQPTNLDDLVKSKGFEQVTPETIAQSYNRKTWYHGTGTDKLTKDSLDPFVGSHESLFGQGVYLTDNPKIAEGYANSRGKRTKTPTVYEANVNVGRVLDLEKPITPDVAAAIDKTVKSLDYQYNYHFEEPNHFTNLVNDMVKNGDTPEQIITAIRKEVTEFSHEAEIPTSEFVENFQDLAVYLKEAGYDGLTHTGGHRTGNEAHRVLIMLDPQGHKWSRDVHPNQVTRFEKYNPEARPQREQPLPEGVSAMRVKGAEPIKRSETVTPEPAAAPKVEMPKVNVDTLPDVPQRGTTNAVKPISRTEVIQNLKKNLGVVIDTGRLGTSSKAVLGFFKTKPEVIRTRAMHDVSTIAHEVGHALEKRFKLVDPHFRDEFMNILQKHSDIDMKAYKPHELQEEGFAEYMRLLLTDPKLAFEAAPKFSQHLLNKLPPKVVAALRNSQSDIARWLQQDGFHSAMGKIDFIHGKSTRKFNFNNFYTRMFDDLNPLKLAMNALYGKRAHLIKTANENAYKLARLSRGMAERAQLAIERGIYDDSGRKISEGLADAVKDLEKLGVTEQEFSTYLSVIHAMDLKAQGKAIPFTDDEIKSTLAELDSKAMRAVQQKILNYNNALLDLLVDAEVVNREAVVAMRQKYPNYVPFMRFFDDDLTDGFKQGGYGNSRGFANLTNPIKRMSEEGSERTLVDPLQSMVKNTFVVMNAAAKNKVGLQLVKLAQVDGAGRLLELLPEGGANAREHIITVKINGENQAIKIRQPELYDAMLSLDDESTNSLVKFLGVATNILRGGATLTPEFIVRNALRDIWNAMVTVGFNPINFVRGMYYALSPQLKKMGLEVANNRLDEFISSGGAMSTLMSTTRDYSRQTMKQAFRKSLRNRTMNVVTNPKQLAKEMALFFTGITPLKGTIKVLRAGAEFSEFSTKLGKFDSRIRKGDSLQEAAFQARDLMDFNRAGSSIRQANRLIAFMNASLQGTDKLARAFKYDPMGTMIRGFTTLTVPTLALHVWYANMSDEQKKIYANIPQWQKDLFFIVPGPNNTFIRIPKPFEAGLLFSTLADRIVRDQIERDPEAWNGFAKSAITTFTPPVMIQFFNPILEGLSNYSFFRDAPIVPMSLQDEKNEYQYDIYTSETAKSLGKVLSNTPLGKTPFSSPKVIDNTITGYTAELGKYGLAGIDAIHNLATGGKGNQRPAKRLEETALISPFMAKTSGSGQIRNDFYDRLDEITKDRNSAKTHPEVKFDQNEYTRLNNANNQMKKLSKNYKIVLNDPTLTAKEKRAKLDVLDQEMNDLAYNALKKVRQ